MFIPAGDVFLSASDDFLAKMWSLDGIVLKTLIHHRHSVHCAVFNATGDSIVTASVMFDSTERRLLTAHVDGIIVMKDIIPFPDLPLFHILSLLRQDEQFQKNIIKEVLVLSKKENRT